MVSRRNFISICIMMAVILALFQFSLWVRDFGSNYNTNVHLSESTVTQSDSWTPNRTGVSAGPSLGTPEGPPAGAAMETVVYIGSGEKTAADIVKQWGTYSKRQVVQYNSIEEYAQSGGDAPLLLCIDGSEISTNEQVSLLSMMAMKGQSMVFCDFPDVATLEQMPAFRDLLGIQTVEAETVELTGIKLFSGFLLGGEAIYQATTEKEQEMQDLTLTVPWFLIRSGSKTYMVGLLEDETIKNEELPALIWRNSYGNAHVYVVNGPYMYDETGLGILSAIAYEMQSYELYPVVNAQNLSVVNFPDFALENTEEMTEIYARDLRRLQMDLLWPNLIASANKGDYKMTCFMTPQMDYTVQGTLMPEDLTFYLKQFREQGAEAGLAMDYLPGVDLREKLERDLAFFADAGNEYEYGAAYINREELNVLVELSKEDLLDSIRTVTGIREATDAILTYYSDTILDQGVTADGFKHTYSQDLRARALETALGYSNILLDMSKVTWPEEDEPHWEVLYDTFSSNINTFWKPFTAFDKTTISESDSRVRNFLSLDYADSRDGDSIIVDISNRSGETYFLLRTHGESVQDMTGGTCREIEQGTYLICAQEDRLEIKVERDDQPIYYLP